MMMQDLVLLLLCQTFAMSGALAWQVIRSIIKLQFCVLGGRTHGAFTFCPGFSLLRVLLYDGFSAQISPGPQLSRHNDKQGWRTHGVLTICPGFSLLCVFLSLNAFLAQILLRSSTGATSDNQAYGKLIAGFGSVPGYVCITASLRVVQMVLYLLVGAVEGVYVS